jgi:hypothetical protein
MVITSESVFLSDISEATDGAVFGFDGPRMNEIVLETMNGLKRNTGRKYLTPNSQLRIMKAKRHCASPDGGCKT